MNSFPESLNNLIDEFSRFPGIGKKTAQRMAFYILNSSKSHAYDLSEAVLNLKSKIRFCEKCYGISEEAVCTICSDARRDVNSLCVVENPADIYTFEKTSAFRGLYHVLGGVLSPLDGIGPDELNIAPLLQRITPDVEVLIATNATIEGEATAHYIREMGMKKKINISRLAFGLPLNGEISFLDNETISHAFNQRKII